MINGNQNQSMTQKVKHAIKSTPQAFQLLGHCIYWGSMSGVDIAHQDFLKILEELGIDKDIAKEVRLKSSATKAVRTVAQGLGKNTFHKKTADEGAVAAFAIVNSQVSENHDVAFQQATKAVFNKDNSTLQVEGDNSQKILENFEKFKGRYDGENFRSTVLRFLDQHCQGISLRERGGIYFVPISHQDQFEKLEALLGHFNIPCNVLPLVDDEKSKKAALDALDSDVRGEIANLQAEIDAANGDMSDKMRENRIASYRKLKEKVEHYDIFLSGKASQLKADLDKVTERLRKVITS
jgi:hypothetical protein